MNDQLKIMTCGSVDDGKSTLIGHMLYDSKLLYTDQIKTLELDSKIKNNGVIDYSLLLDGLDEEREQGITIDVAYRYFNTQKRSFIILDSPGHEEYTRNMAVGASQADIAILLIDATKGVLLQTKRHLKICLMMGIKDYVVAVNKMDLIDYSQNVYENIVRNIKKMFKNQKYNTLKIIPVSATVGDNIISSSLNMQWYEDMSLIEYLENVKIYSNENNKFILPVQRVCRPNQKFRGFQGNVASGKIAIRNSLFCLPSRQKANIKELYNTNQQVSQINNGEAVTIVLDKEIDVSRGCVLTNDENVAVSNKLNITLLWLDGEELKINTAYHLKISTINTLCYIRKINYKLNIDSGRKNRVNNVRKNDIVNCDIEVLESIPVTEFNYNKTLGSMIIINRVTNATSACAVINEVSIENEIYKFNSTLTKDDRKRSLNQQPITIWFTGLSCSGKSTIANELDKMLNKNGFHTMLLDGDNIRLGLNKNLTFSKGDRIENIRRIAEVAKLMNDAGLICITSFITPLEINRVMARQIIGEDFILVYVNTSIEECKKRDKKGIYIKAEKGIIKEFTGVSSPYEEPTNADLILVNNDYKECARIIYKYIEERIKI